MPQHAIELILARQLASHLAVAIFIVDPIGNLVFYNEPAEGLLGYRFEDTGEMPAAEWSSVFAPIDRDGEPLDPLDLPLVSAMAERRPSHGEFGIRGLDGQDRWLEVTAFPIVGEGEQFLGAVAVFWEGTA